MTKEQQIFALWKNASKKDGKTYYSNKELVAFPTSKKKNPKEPDLRIFKQGEELKPYLSLWTNESKDKTKVYLTGKLDGKRVVGFINNEATAENKKPFISVYYADEKAEAKPVETAKALNRTLL